MGGDGKEGERGREGDVPLLERMFAKNLEN
jgi:hypothetical protein